MCEADVVVVGAGISGLAAAVELGARGARVVVLDKEATVGAEASGRAQGSLRLQGRHAAEMPLAEAAIQRWHAIADDSDAEIQFNGNVYLAQSTDELAVLRTIVSQSHKSGLTSTEILTAENARRIIPAATGPFLGVMFSPVDGQADPSKVTRYNAERARGAGVTIQLDTRVIALDASKGRIAGVHTDDGHIRCRAVILASGVWTPYLAATAGVPVPIMPVVLTTGETQPLDITLGPTLRSAGFSAKQRPDGCVVIDAGMNCRVTHKISLADTRNPVLWLNRLVRFHRSVRLSLDIPRIVDELRYRKRCDPRAIPVGTDLPINHAELNRALAAMRLIFPAGRTARIRKAWAGMIDMSPDGLPFLGVTDRVQGLIIACGFSGHGFTLGPITGRITAQLALGESPDFYLEPFRPDRAASGRLDMPDRMM